MFAESAVGGRITTKLNMAAGVKSGHPTPTFMDAISWLLIPFNTLCYNFNAQGCTKTNKWLWVQEAVIVEDLTKTPDGNHVSFSVIQGHNHSKKKCLTLQLSSLSCARPTNLYQYHQGRALLIHAKVSTAFSPWTSHTGLLILRLKLALMHSVLFFTFVLLLREFYSQHLCEVRKLSSQNVVCHSMSSLSTRNRAHV